MNISKHDPRQSGSALIMILITIALFAALSFAISKQRGSGDKIASEKTRLFASDILDAGSKMSDTISQMRLRKVPINQISFANDIVTNYDNPSCTTDKCLVFSYGGGARDWEKPTNEINGGADWGFTGDVSVKNIGTDSADLMMILPNLPLSICTRINKLLGIDGISPAFSGVVANKYIGAFATVPTELTSPLIDGKSAACIELSSPSGSALSGTYTNRYAFYQVISAR